MANLTAECILCGKALTADEIGASRKLINRATERFYCLPCLAEKFHIDPALLREKIEEWRAYGCMLFPPKE